MAGRRLKKRAEQPVSESVRREIREAEELERRKRPRERGANQNARNGYGERWDVLPSTCETTGLSITFREIP